MPCWADVYEGHRLYWIGQYEAVRPRIWRLFLHVDWAPTILEYGNLILVPSCEYSCLLSIAVTNDQRVLIEWPSTPRSFGSSLSATCIRRGISSGFDPNNPI